MILCVRNGAGTIADQLAALADQECSHPWELVVVDNGSSDHTVEVVEQWRERVPDLRLVSARERAGLAYARNAGAGAAEGRVLAFCDADDVADSHWLAALVDGARTAEIVGGRLELETLNSEVARYWRGMSEDDRCRPGVFDRVHYAMGANFAVRREAFDAVGGCDEAFTVCGDDVDLSWRIQRRGGEITFRQDAVMHYRLRDDLRGLARQRFEYGKAESLLRRRLGDEIPPVRLRERWPTYRYLLTRSWHLLADDKRRGGWVAAASYCAGRIRGSQMYGVLNY